MLLTFDLATFFEKIRPFFGNSLTQGQVQNMKVLLGLGATEIDNLEAMAYVLATVRHEAGPHMTPITEIGKGYGHPYGGKVDMDGKPYTTPDQLYYGRGHVQLTWRCNYVALGHLVGLENDLLYNPDLMLMVHVSAHVAILGMVKGSFTGRKLADYFGPGRTPDPVNARKIINGLDQAELIKGYYIDFLEALQAAQQAALQAAVVIATSTQGASVTEAQVSAPNLATAASAAAPGLVTAVVVAAPAPAAEKLLLPNHCRYEPPSVGFLLPFLPTHLVATHLQDSLLRCP